MVRRGLLRVAELALSRAGLVALFAALPCLALSYVGFRAPTDLSFIGIADRSDPLVDAYLRVSERLAFAGRLPLLLEGPDDRLEEAARALEPALEEHPRVADVVVELPERWLREHAPWFVERPLFDAWLGLATKPGDVEGPRRLAEGLEALERERERATPTGARLVLVRMTDDFLSLDAGGGAFLEIEARTMAVLAPFDVEASFGGLAAIAAQDQSRTLGMVQLLSPLSLFLVLLLFRLVERNLLRLALAATPMLLSIGATLGLVSLLTGRLTVMETFFGVMVFGLGVDFALHLMVRLRDERARGLPFADALRTTWTGTAPGVVSGGLTTAGAFSLCAFAPDPLALHLGLSGGIGLGLCLLLMTVLLPALLALLERRMPVPPSTTPVPVPLLGSVVDHAARHPRAYVAAALVVLVGGAYGGTRYQFETDLSKVFNRDVPALKAMERIQELFGVNPAPYLVLASDLDEVRRVSAGFAREPLFDRVDSVARFFPPDLEERRALLTSAREDIAAQRAVYEALLPLTTEDEAKSLELAIQALDALDRALAVGPPRLDALPPALAAELLGPGGELVVYAYPKQPTIDGRKAREERLAAQRVHPDVVGFGFLLEAVMAQDRPWVWPVLLGILCLVALIVLVDLRRPKLVFLALVPVVTGTVLTFGALCLAGVRFNVLTTLVVPLLIGLGVDDGIHVVHRIRERSDASLRERVTSVGRAIFLTTATTVVSFSTLLFTNHAGLEGMALVVLVGLPLCLTASVTLVPALAVLLGVASADGRGAAIPPAP